MISKEGNLLQLKDRRQYLVAIPWTRIGARWAIQIGAENCDDFDSFAVCVSV